MTRQAMLTALHRNLDQRLPALLGASLNDKDVPPMHGGRPRRPSLLKALFALSGVLLAMFGWLASCDGLAAAETSPAAMISDFRLQHGEGRVTLDATLNRIAQQQASAMAEKDTLDHDVLGSFRSRIAPARAGRAAENIAYGYDRFDKTLGQWISSIEHRNNLLLPKASRVGIANATSASSHRVYWAMVIAGDYDARPPTAGKGARVVGTTEPASAPSCRLKILGLCW